MCSLGLTAGCSDDPGTSDGSCTASEGNLGIELKAELAVTQNGAAAKDLYSFDASSLGGPKAFVFQIQNVVAVLAARPLQINSVVIVETDNDGKIPENTGFSCIYKGAPCADAKFGSVIPNGFTGDCVPADATESEELLIRYDHGGITGTRKALLRIRVNGDPKYATDSFDIRFETTEGQPRISCTPSVVDFGQLKAGASATELIECRSIGSAPVVLKKVELFSKEAKLPLTVGIDNKWILTLDEPYEGKPEISIAPGQVLSMAATLTDVPTDEPIGATMHIFSNDTSIEKAVVQLFANSTGPCFQIKPANVDFGEVPVGATSQQEVQLKGCGSETAKIEHIGLTKGSNPDFALDFTAIGGAAPTKEKPLEVFPGGTITFVLECNPSSLNGIVSAVVELKAADGSERSVSATCKAAKLAKPVACIDPVQPGSTVIPQTPLTLTSKCSKASEGQKIKSYQWSVTQPQGSIATIGPNNSAKAIGLQPNVAGDYEFELVVTDDTGAKSDPAKVLVNVLPDNKLHIEATWVQEGDKDKTDDKGCDIDLHLAHPLAPTVKGQKDYDNDGQPDPWFAQCYDCFWLNCNPGGQPVWGDPADLFDDPTVDLDDTDGWGPENLSIKYPEKTVNGKPAWYWIGLYVFSDAAMGKCTPKVRIFLDSTEVFNKKGPDMVTKDMWCAGKVKWDGAGDAADVVPCFSGGTGQELRPKYPFLSPSAFTCPPPI